MLMYSYAESGGLTIAANTQCYLQNLWRKFSLIFL